MPPTLFRIGAKAFPVFDGGGAALAGARWNNVGRRIIYTGANLSLCRLEILAHTDDQRPPRDRVWSSVEVPIDVMVDVLEEGDLPNNWDHRSIFDVSRAIGDAWHDSRRSLVLRVPSVASRGDHVYLINQDHPEFAKLNPTPPLAVDWDSRLFEKRTP